MKKVTLYAFLYPIFSVLFLYSCQNTKNTKDMQVNSDITSIEYRFGDSSVPPPYHRSFSIIVNAEKLRFVVDSYGDVIKDTTVAISKEKWESCKSLIKSCKIQKAESSKNAEGCTGGTTRNIKVLNNDKVVLEAGNYYCGGQIFGDLKGDIEAFVTKLKEGINPNIFMHE